jgi:hypothetical protein
MSDFSLDSGLSAQSRQPESAAEEINTTISESSPLPTPTLRSRYFSPIKQLQSSTAATWLSTTPFNPSTCPINAITVQLTTSTTLALDLLSKYSPTKFAFLYAQVRTLERIHIVDDLKTEIRSRREQACRWREVLDMAAEQQSTSEEGEAWEKLGAACQRLLDVMGLLEKRLEWCERNFEKGRMGEGIVKGRRVWDEGREIREGGWRGGGR